jgi:hypothetical protein
MADALRRRRVERVHGFSVGRQITLRGSAAMEHSARRYIEPLAEDR